MDFYVGIFWCVVECMVCCCIWVVYVVEVVLFCREGDFDVVVLLFEGGSWEGLVIYGCVGVVGWDIGLRSCVRVVGVLKVLLLMEWGFFFDMIRVGDYEMVGWWLLLWEGVSV